MKIVTYNMQHDKKSKANWSAIFDKVQPDILLAQESLHPDQYQRPLVDDSWSRNAVWASVCGQWGSAVFVKSEVAKSIELPGFNGWVVGVELDDPRFRLTSSKVRVFSLHAPTGKGDYHKVVARILDMLQEHRNGCDVVIGGDFNLTVSERHASEVRKNKKANLGIQARLREFGLINCWQTMHPDVPLAQTLRWDTNPKPAYHCDGIFVPQEWTSRLVSCEVLSGETWVALSDHNPVVAEFA